MEAKPMAPRTVDEYISGFPPEVRTRLEAIRAIVREEAPGAVERIAYGMPAFSSNGDLVYFAAHKKHIGLYPLPGAIELFKDRLAAYKTAKGSVQFPFDEELPLDLIRDIVRARVEGKALKIAGTKG
jgi:uncharacterized protein YdhG (YjbR/CyaY superfamily)